MYNFDVLTYTLGNGRLVRLQRLFQSITYEGMLAALPSEHGNEYFIEQAVRLARNVGAIGSGAPVVLVSPKFRQWNPSRDETYPFLPEVPCNAHLTSEPTNSHHSTYRSSMTVVWFQHSFAPPFDPEVERFICALDWDQLAEDFEP